MKKKVIQKFVTHTGLIFIFLLQVALQYVYSQWTQIGNDVDGDLNFVQMGTSVATSSDGTVFATGMPSYDASGKYGNGRVKVFTLVNGNWMQKGAPIDGENNIDDSGKSIALSADGNIIAIGAPACSAIDNRRGRVRVYQFINGVWNKIGGNIDGGGAFYYFGESVDLSSDGHTVVVGARGDGGFPGQVSVYKYINGNWIQQGLDIWGLEASSYFGKDVAISSNGTRIAVGSPYYGLNDHGMAAVYDYINGNWILVGNIIPGEADIDISGWSVSLSNDGNILAVGAPQNSGFKGHTRVFQLINNVWVQLGNDIDGEALSDKSGFSVSLNSDGKRVAIGAPANAGGSFGAGHVRIYDHINGNWIQVDNDIDGEAWGDASGFAVELSATGDYIAIGAPENDAGGINRGHVRIYYNPVCVVPLFTICPLNISAYTNPGLCSSKVIYSVAANGNPSPVLSYQFSGATTGNGSGSGSGSNFNSGLTYVSLKAINNCGMATCDFTVFIQDNEKPQMSCPNDITLFAPTGICELEDEEVDLGNAIASDNCNVKYPLKNNAPSSYPIGITQVKWTARDYSNNAKSCFQKVHIIAENCGQPVGVYHEIISENVVKVHWQEGICVTTYLLRIRKEISPGIWDSWSSWVPGNGMDYSHVFTSLIGNSNYHYQIRSKCGTEYSITVNGWFTTPPPGGSLSQDVHIYNAINGENLSDLNLGSAPEMHSKLIIYPNPATTFLRIEFNNKGKQNGKFAIYNAMNQVQLYGNLQIGLNVIPLQLNEFNFRRGVYFIRITIGNENYSSKFTIL